MAAKGLDPRLHALCAAALVALGLVAYSNSFDGPFIFDDEYAVPDNPRLASSSPWQWLTAPPESAAAGRPVVTWSIALNYAVDGFDVRGYHALNLALHLASGLLVYGIARRSLNGPALASRFGVLAQRLAWVIAAIWLVHPLDTEAVNYIIQRTELLMGVFYLLTLYAAIRAWDDAHAPRWAWLSVGACVLGMGSKEVMASAPLMVVLYDRAFWVSSWREAFRRRWKLYLALAGSWLVLGSLMALMPRAGSVGFGLGMSSWQYAQTQCWAIAHYLRLSFWPVGLCLDYGEQPVTDLAHWLPGGILLLGLASATLWAWRRHPTWGFLGAWFFLILAPSSSFVPIVTEVAAERRMYLPLAAVVSATVVGGYEFGRRIQRGSHVGLRGWRRYRDG
ncbi:MAG TPA: glycosyltransferase family 39 protein, partial [Pirellulales bacterium]